jgi:hypothetical protein
MSEQPPSLIYRDAVRQLLWRYQPVTAEDPDEGLRRHLESLTSQSDPFTRFVVAAGLLSYGRIDLAEDLLDCLPEGRGSVRELARALVGLLPAPPHLDPLHEPEAFRVWLRQNRDRVHWDPTLGKFIWNDDVNTAIRPPDSR